MKLILICCLALSCLQNTKQKTQNYTQQTDLLKESMVRGSDIYNDFCVSCHLPNGEGVAGVYPPLAKSDYLMQKPEESIRAIKYGQKGEIIVNGETYNNRMPALGLSDDEVADVMNYATNSWGNENNILITEEDVSKVKK